MKNEADLSFESLLTRALDSDTIAIWNLMAFLDANPNQQAEQLYQQLTAMLKENPQHSGALTLLGILYHRGWGTEKNLAAAMKHFKMAAELGNAEAMCRLAMMIEDGGEDVAAAIRLYEKSIALGNASAMYRMGNIFLWGKTGININYQTATHFFNQAIERGHPEAMNNRGYMALYGLGMVKDPNIAAHFFDDAINAGHLGAILNRLCVHRKTLLECQPDVVIALETKFKSHFNFLSEKNLRDFASVIARTELFSVMPLPTETDKGYAEFYARIQQMQQTILLAHRFGIQATGTQQGVEYSANGAVPSMMIREMQISFADYLKSGGVEEMLAMLAASPFRDVINAEWFDNIIEDTQSVILEENSLQIAKHDGELLLLSPAFQHRGVAMWHNFSVAFFRNFCLIADRLERPDRIFLLKSAASPASLTETKDRVAREITQHAFNFAPDNNPITNGHFHARLKEANFQLLKTIPAKDQYADTCTWLSAKSMLFSILYFRLYELALTITDENGAHTLATEYAHKLHRLWTTADRIKFLNTYLQSPQPDPVIVAHIYLKYQYRKDDHGVAQIIETAKLPNDADMAAARKQAFQATKPRVVRTLKQESPTLSHIFTEDDIEQLSQKFSELSFRASKDIVEKAYSDAFKFVLFPARNANQLLDTLLVKAKTL